ncbi:MAG TPA: hypothetical protein VFO69_00750 [Allosphingosinicella sp.]|nr:hypothetical protein [Allosphingosinicella sp.]
MSVMNRLSPMIARRSGALTAGRTGPRAAVAAVDWQSRSSFHGAEPARWLDELKLFATGWIGGLIFFGTYLG